MPTGIPHENVYIRTKDGVKLNLILLRYTGGDPATGVTTGISSCPIDMSSNAACPPCLCLGCLTSSSRL
uniref:Uncharacterized protein n=1 Tax=Knipowitschia caucasica TaxID=637954 RepID=A0AAV2K3U7_KNICA